MPLELTRASPTRGPARSRRSGPLGHTQFWPGPLSLQAGAGDTGFAPGLLSLQASVGNQVVARLLAQRDASIGDAIGSVLSTALRVSIGAIHLHGSVGRGGKNLPDDVQRVRDRLAELGFTPGEGVAGLAEAINRYQVEVVGLARADGRVDVGGKTLAGLNLGRRAPKPAAKPKPTEPSQTAPTAAPTSAPAAAATPAAVGDLAGLVAQAQNPSVTAAAAKLAELAEKFRTIKHGAEDDYLHQGEQVGPERAELVHGIRDLRLTIAGLDDAGVPLAQLKAIKAALYHGINAVSPYYYQHNNVMYEYSKKHGDTAQDKQTISHGFNTCNITSLAMALEALGKSAADYKKPELMQPVLQFFKGHELKKSGVDASADLSAYRLPDVLGMAATIENLAGGAHAKSEEIQAAAGQTLGWLPNIENLRQLALQFGVQGFCAEYHHTELAKFGKTHHAQADQQADKRKKQSATSNSGLSDENLEREVPLKAYTRDIMQLICPVMEQGKQVVVGQFFHFVRLQSLDANFVIKDDPGNYDRNDLKMTWEEARAAGLFENYLVLG